MIVNRRSAIRQLLFVSAGIAILPACVQDDKSKASVLLKNMKLSGAQEKMLEELTETIIPATDTPGAKAIYAHLFVLKMMDDCHSGKDQEEFMKGMDLFERKTRNELGKPFVEAGQADREKWIAALEKAKDNDPALTMFYQRTRGYTIEAYTSSKFYLTNVQVYKLVPGKFKGCMPA